MDENYLQELYQGCIDPWGDVPEEFRHSEETEFDHLSSSWDKGEPFNHDWPIREWIKFQMEHDLIKASVLDWEIFKQVIDDLLADDHLRAIENIIKFCVVPKVKKYPTIQQYNFSYEPHLKDYVDKVFEWLRYIDGHLFRITELGEFKNGEFKFIIKDHQKERLQTLKDIIQAVEEDHQRHEEQDIAYELAYQHNEIRIKGSKKPLHKLTDNSQGQKLFEELWEHKGSQVLKEGLIAKGVKINRAFNDLLKDMKFVNSYGNLFVPDKSQDSATLYHIITHTQLKEAKLDYLSPDALTELMQKKT